MRPRAVALVVGLLLAAVACGDGSGDGSEGAAGDPPPPSTEPPAPSSTTGSLPPPPTAGGSCDPAEAIASWPLRQRVAALVMVGVDPGGPDDARAVVEGHGVGGVFVGGDPTGLLTSGALQELRDAAPLGLLVAVDEEGGRVQRIEALDGDVPSARRMAATMTPDEVEALAARRARVMADHGVTVDLAPVVDVSDQPDGEVIGDRSWSDDPDEVVAYARAYAAGLLAEGVAPVLKHFPGHGASSGDTHDGAASTPPLDELRARDLVPYRVLLPELGAQAAVMLGHLDVPGLTEEGTPTSLSPATVRLLREGYGFDGVVMTDDLAAMRAVTARFGVAEAATRALAAGVDVVLLAGADVGDLLDHLEAAVGDGDLDEASIDASVARVLAFGGTDPCTAGA